MASRSVNIKDYRTEVPGAFNETRTAWLFPAVVTTNSHGKESRWQIRVSLATLPVSDPPVFIVIDDKHYDDPNINGATYGWFKVDTGIDGNISKRAATIITSGKNLGKKSATNVFTQALRDALGLYNTQAKKATGVVVANNEATPIMYPPMLAQVYSAVYKTSWPLAMQLDKSLDKTDATPATCYIQPKYNGVRGMFVYDRVARSVIMYSRRKNLYPGFAYIKSEIEPVLAADQRQIYFDGELYKHGVPLQDISGYARREDQVGDIKLDFMLYDCYVADNSGMLYVDRKAILDNVFANNNFTYTKQVPTTACNSLECATGVYTQALADKYEGAMVRLNAPYRVSYNEYHSPVLLKMKPVFDAELAIVSYGIATKGKAAGALMITCSAGEGLGIFPVTPAMEITDRVALAKRMGEIETNGKTHFENHWLGTKIIVEYDELSKDQIPLRARTKMAKRTWD